MAKHIFHRRVCLENNLPAPFFCGILQAPGQDRDRNDFRTIMAAIGNDQSALYRVLCFVVFHIASQVQLGTGSGGFANERRAGPSTKG